MTALAVTHPTLLDFTRELGADGKIQTDIAEVLRQTNRILDYLPFTMSNETTGHKSIIRSGLPEPTWRELYGGVQPTKGESIAVRDTIGMLESYCEVDKALADLGGNTVAFRRNQEVAHIQGMTHEMASTFLYGNEKTERAAFTGLSPRYLLSTGAINSTHVLKTTEDSASTNSDIWILGLGINKIFGVFPQGSKAGITYQDFGEVTIGDSTNGYYQGYRSHFRWDMGLVVEDWQYGVRIHWGTTSAATFISAGTGTPLSTMLIEGLELLPSRDDCKPVILMSRKGKSQLKLQIKREMSYNLTRETVAGVPTDMFDGVPILTTDAILNNLAALTA